MFGFLLSQQRKMRQNAANWLDVAERVQKFRRDQLTETESQRLTIAAGDLRRQLKDRADASRLKMSIESLEVVLRDVGGRHYPMSSMTENIEFFLVAAIVILGIRAYFVQPFKIPTNSMWPSYYGMTHELFAPKAEEPGLLARAGRFLAFGATHYKVEAPADGELMVPVFGNYQIAYTEVPSRRLFVFPTTKREYQFRVGGQDARLQVPLDFDFKGGLEEAFRGEHPNVETAFQESIRRNNGRMERSTITFSDGNRRVKGQIYWIPTGRMVKKGETILSFDILTGDLLFVDRLSYNFVRPRIGQGFVFRTDHIASPEMQQPPGSGNQIEQYYIKRLVGGPGDVLEIREPALLRNGAPIEGAAAFGRNARREGTYPGYVADGYLAPERKFEVPEGHYFALGDNSPTSKDGRSWGQIPEKDVVGRPLLIYYPLTKRWGVAR